MIVSVIAMVRMDFMEAMWLWFFGRGIGVWIGVCLIFFLVGGSVVVRCTTTGVRKPHDGYTCGNIGVVFWR